MVFYLPLSAYAQATQAQVQQYSSALSQYGTSVQGGTGTSPTYGQSGTAGLAGAAGSCSIGTLGAALITSTITKAIGAVAGLGQTATGAGTSAVTSSTGQAVPIQYATGDEMVFQAISKNLKDQGQRNFSLNASDGSFNGIVAQGASLGFNLPSLNAIGFCIVNEILAYITQSTIQWINSGFQGSPVFVSNTGEFLQGVEDQELGNFVNGIAEGTLGINLCQPFKVQVLLGTLGVGGRGQQNPLSCTLNAIKNNYNQFVGGNWGSGGMQGWFELTQGANNPYGATMIAQQQALLQVNKQQNNLLINLNWAKGYHDFTYCQDKSTPNTTTGKCSNGAAPVTGTPGDYIQNQVNARAAAPEQRLNIATDFDQLVSALVNELIQIAINKTLESANPNTPYYTPPTYNNTSSGGGSSGGSPVTYTQPVVSCSGSDVYTTNSTASSTSTIIWSASATGGSGNFVYYWNGDAYGNSQNVTNTYSTSGTKNATLTVYDATSGQTSLATCSAVVYGGSTSSITASCSAYPSGNAITWIADTTGGSGNYTYSWSGDAYGSYSSVTNTYATSTSGTKSGTVTVSDASSSSTPATASCSASIS